MPSRRMSGLSFLLAALLSSCAGAPAPIQLEPPGDPAEQGRARPWQAPRDVDVLSWNLGFGGLGEDAEFYPDGGRWLIPSLRRDVLRYVRGIGAFLGNAGADLFLLQEAARPSAVNHRGGLLAAVEKSLPGRRRAYPPEVAIAFPPAAV